MNLMNDKAVLKKYNKDFKFHTEKIVLNGKEHDLKKVTKIKCKIFL